MRQTRLIILFCILVTMHLSCITPFVPDINITDINKFVVTGQVVDNIELQTVSVSMASSVTDPQYIPVSGCYIRILDDLGNEFPMYESGTGIYNVKIDQHYLLPGRSFKIDIFTREGINIESDFDKMSECPVVDSVYYSIKSLSTDTAGIFSQNLEYDESKKNLPTEIEGSANQELRFYVDLHAENLESRFFRWEAIETWENHALYPKEWFYDGAVHHIFPPDYSRLVCWTTETVNTIYSLSTSNLAKNQYIMFPLNFVSNHSQKLVFGYSLLINQYALSEAAYTYWDQLRLNSNEQGGLYEKQPFTITGNLHNKTNPDQEVLGFFSAASVKSKRIFIRNLANFEVSYNSGCQPMAMEHGGFLEINPGDYPAFLKGDSTGFRMSTLSDECVDCTIYGGVNKKPDFWPY
jgi:hypothetical protein